VLVDGVLASEVRSSNTRAETIKAPLEHGHLETILITINCIHVFMRFVEAPAILDIGNGSKNDSDR
jgi:hypothetical protein